MKKIILLSVILLTMVQVGSAQINNVRTNHQNPQWETPLIKGYGPILYYKNALNQPNKNKDYNIVVRIISDVNREGINGKLFLMARLMNMFHAGGVKENHIHMVAVIFGKATFIALNNQAYKKKFGVNNPNLDVLKKLTTNGIKFFVCDQALAEHKIKHTGEVNKYIKNTLAGYMAILDYQQKGFILIQ